MRHQAIRLSIALVTFLAGLAATNFLNFVYFGAAFGTAEREVLKVEREYIRANLEGDVVALENVLADDFTSFRGKVRKEHRLAMLANPYFRVASLETRDVEVSVSGDEARVSGKATLKASLNGRDFESPNYKFTRHLSRRNGRWQITHMRFRPTW